MIASDHTLTSNKNMKTTTTLNNQYQNSNLKISMIGFWGFGVMQPGYGWRSKCVRRLHSQNPKTPWVVNVNTMLINDICLITTIQQLKSSFLCMHRKLFRSRPLTFFSQIFARKNFTDRSFFKLLSNLCFLLISIGNQLSARPRAPRGQARRME